MYAIVFRPWIACQLQQNVNNNDSNKMKFIVFDVKLMKCLLRFPFDAPARKKTGEQAERSHTKFARWRRFLGLSMPPLMTTIWQNQPNICFPYTHQPFTCLLRWRARTLLTFFFHSLHILHWTTLQLTVKLHSLQKLMCVCFTVYDTGFRRICTSIYWN